MRFPTPPYKTMCLGEYCQEVKVGQKYLSDEEEKELLEFLLESAKIGFPRTRKDVISLVQGVLDEKGQNVMVTSGWWEGFKKRHPEISIRVAEQLSYVQASSCNSEILSSCCLDHHRYLIAIRPVCLLILTHQRQLFTKALNIHVLLLQETKPKLLHLSVVMQLVLSSLHLLCMTGNV